MRSIDAKTTPRWLQPLLLLFTLGLSVAFFDASFHALDQPTFRQYIMGWKMFTMKNGTGTDYRAEVQWTPGSDFQRVDLPSYFPSRWGSGYRYSRFRDKRRLTAVAAALCRRMDTPPHTVRITKVRWPLRPGSTDRAGSKETVMVNHRCARKARLSDGRTVPLHPSLVAEEAAPAPRRPRRAPRAKQGAQ